MTAPATTTPRDLALQHYRDRLSLVEATGEVAGLMWAEVEARNIADSWALQIPELTAVVSGAQLGAARPADDYTRSVLDADDVDPEPIAEVDPRAFSGIASDGRGLATLLANPAIATLLAIQDGVDVARALAMGRANLDMLVRTQVADAGRIADQVSLVARREPTGYVRVAVGGSCARCLLLAGRTYRWSAGFQRHPRCDCIHLPAGIAKAGRLAQHPRQIYDRMSPAERARAGFTRADQRAIADGADLYAVVNAKRGMYTAGGRRFTREGTTRRGLFGGYEIDPDTGALRKRTRDELTRLPGQRIRSARAARLTPEQIYRDAGGDRAEAIRLLRANGYLTGQPAAVVRRDSVRLAASVPSPAAGAARGVSARPAVRQQLAEAKTARDLQRAYRAEFQRITGRDALIQLGPPGTSLATAREHAEGVLRGLERFPDARIRTISWINPDGGLYARAGNGEIEFNAYWSSVEGRRRYLRSLGKDVADWERGIPDWVPGWHPRNTGSPTAMAIHEVGHIIDLDNLGDRIHPEVLDIVRRRAAELAIDPDRLIRREVSGYAATNTDELVAEAFLDVMVNGDTASVLSRQIFDLLEAEYRKGGFRTGVTRVARSAADDLSRMTVVQLRALAKERGIRVPSKARKADIVALIRRGPRDAFDTMTVAQLRAEAARRAMKIPARSRKADIVALLKGESPRPKPPRSVRRSGVDLTAQTRDAAWIRQAELRQALDFEDAVLTDMVRRQPDWGVKARVITADKLDEAVASGWTELWRGVFDDGGGMTAAQAAQATRTGAWRMGRGIYGNGVYLTRRRTTAEIYRNSELHYPQFGHSLGWGPGPLYEWRDGFTVTEPRGLLRMAIDPKAKLITYSDLKRDHLEFLRSEGYLSLPESAWKRSLEDTSFYAAMKGYDGVWIRHTDGNINDGAPYPNGVRYTDEADQYIIFNRSVLIMEKASDRFDP